MLDIQILRDNVDAVAANLANRGFAFDKKLFNQLEHTRKTLQQATGELQQQKNILAKEIGLKKRQAEDATELLQQAATLETKLTTHEKELKDIQQQLNDFLLQIPNVLHESVPFGMSEHDNVLYKEWGVKPSFNFTPVEHFDLAISKEQLDFNTSAKLSGARFVVMYNKIAKLHRALAQFMLDTHVTRHGYQEVYVPLLVKSECLYGVGQLPKFQEDLFKTDSDADLWLIPTAEVSLTNLHRETIIPAEQLPLKYVASTPCFRKEAGSYGKDTRGIMRQHQFEKIELVQIVAPETSMTALDELLGHAEYILQALKLPYRVVTLCSKDIGFSAHKTYDIEVWLPGQNAYREISSCSNTFSFQARRMKTRAKAKQDPKTHYVHTLNGSGVAVGRALIAVLENYQTATGDVVIPEVLEQYMTR